MKKIAIYGVCLVLMLLASCQQDRDDQSISGKKGFTVKVLIDDIVRTGAKTRVPSEEGEKNVNSLYLAFFKYTGDGSGEYKGYYEVENDLSMISDVVVTAFTDGTYEETEDYSILAFANLEQASDDANGYIGSASDFLSTLEERTEKQVIASLLTLGDAGTDEADDSHVIARTNLFMSGSASKMNGDDVTTVKLKRGVSRFDIENNSDRDLVSASIWGAASTTTVWESNLTSSQHTQRFYGLKNLTGKTLKGGLYAFENTILEPSMGDKETTCLIVGLKKDDKVAYFRANIHQAGEGQYLKRNYCYNLVINSVTGEGSKTEYEAWKQTKSELFVTVNAWNLDDNGLILTDGTNTLGIPVKRIRLDPAGDVREYSIYTVGNGTLQITKSDLPEGITAVIEGNVLKVTGTALPSTQESRRGNIEISYAGLRGSVDIIQEPMKDKILTLDRNTIANFSPLGRYGMTEGAITVTASGPWSAKIVNTYDGDLANPGFSFNPSGDPVIGIKSATNPYGDKFQIYTTGDNPYDNGEERIGFLVVSLDEDPENYSIAVPLAQSKKPNFEIKPLLSEVRFTPDGTPSDKVNSAGQVYKFIVASSETPTITLGGANADKFTLSVAPDNKTFSIKANGTNGGAQQKATITVSNGNTDKDYVINVVQEAGSIRVTVTGQAPATGGSVQVNVDVAQGLTWKAEITEQWKPTHQATIEGGTGTSSGSFNVKFDALVYPNVNVSPVVKVKVSLGDGTSIYQMVDVMQLPLALTSLRILDVYHYSYGSLGGADNWFGSYNRFLRNASFFGPGGKVKTPEIRITENSTGTSLGTISSEYRYVHCGRPDTYNGAKFSSIEAWRKANDGVVMFVVDNPVSTAFGAGTTLALCGYTRGTPRLNARINAGLMTSGTTLQKNIMSYLLKDGPFGVVNNAATLSFDENAHATAAAGYPTAAVPVIKGGNGNGDAMLVIDPANKLVYLGEAQFFWNGYSSSSITTDRDRFLGNLLSYVLNAALGGTNFTDIFADDAKYKELVGK